MYKKFYYFKTLQKNSYEFYCFLVVFWCLLHLIDQSRPDIDSKSDSFKDLSEVLLLKNVNFTLFNLLKNKNTKTCKSSYECYCFLVVFWCLIHLIGQSRPDTDSKNDSLKDLSEVSLLQNVNFTLFNLVKNKLTKTCKSSYEL